METEKEGIKSLKVIIVGGAVAGLTLAHCLYKANIEFVVLESRKAISPPAGAGQQIAANGCRILDQLEILEAIEKVSTAWTYTRIFEKNGKPLVADDAVRLIEKRLGYHPHLMERQELLQVLYDTQHEKGRIHFNKRVTEIIHSDIDVVANCSDGSKFIGDVIVGADGIRSRVRRSMRVHMVDHEFMDIARSDMYRISAESAGIFGVAYLPKHLDNAVRRGDFCRTIAKGRSGFLMPLDRRRIAWVFCVRLPVRIPGIHIPKYTDVETEAVIHEHQDFHLHKDITVGDLFLHTGDAKMVPLEEANISVWTWDRFVFIGDAVSKMTPNLGQGSNQAIESAATLANCLKTMLKWSHGRPALSEVQSALQS